MTPEELYKDAYERYYHRLVYFASLLIKDLPASEDIVHKVVSVIGLGKFTPKDENHLRGFLYMSVSNGCKDYKRYHRRHLSGDMPEDIISDDDIEASIIRTEVLEGLFQRIKQLPGNRRTVLELIYLEGLTVQETATKMGKGVDEIRSLRSKALSKLKQITQ